MNKLQARSSKCVFLGYALGYKRAIYYDLESKRLILSRYAVHNEDEFPYRTESVQDSNISTQSQNARINTIVIQMPIPAIQNQVPQSNSVPIQEL